MPHPGSRVPPCKTAPRAARIRVAAGLLALLAASPAAAAMCRLDFTIEITQGVGAIRPGDTLPGMAQFTTRGPAIRQEGGSTAHLAQGEMRLGTAISGEIWTLIVTSDGAAADLIGVYARDVAGLSFGGFDYEGPMALTLFGPAGSRDDPDPPLTQQEWDDMSLRRAFSLHAHGRDMLAGRVTELVALCT